MRRDSIIAADCISTRRYLNVACTEFIATPSTVNCTKTLPAPAILAGTSRLTRSRPALLDLPA
jgi:hypothetical protein